MEKAQQTAAQGRQETMRSYGRFAMYAIASTVPLLGASRRGLATANVGALTGAGMAAEEAYGKFAIVLSNLRRTQAANRHYALAFRKANNALDQLEHLRDHIDFLKERMENNNCA